MSKAEYRAKWYGETLEEAQVKIDEINSNNNKVNIQHILDTVSDIIYLN